MKNHLILLLLCGALLLAGTIFSSANVVPQAYLPMVVQKGSGDEVVAFGRIYEGDGTFYDADGGGNCLFDPSPDVMIAAINHDDYANSALCGAFVRVSGPDGTIIVKIVDRCADCPAHDIDLHPEAFDQIAERHMGRVPVTWQLVSPPVKGNIVYRWKDTSNPWWSAVQIRNHRTPIQSVEFRQNGQWVDLERAEWNHFVAHSGMGAGPVSLRVTDVFGRILIDHNISILDDATHPGSGQFPPPP